MEASEEYDLEEDFPHLTDSDLALIDAISTTPCNISPIKKYRKSGILSVTDLSAPAWYVLTFDQVCSSHSLTVIFLYSHLLGVKSV